jgi:hypothetical protein
VAAALDELPELDRRIIIRRFVDEEKATQIGERLGLPASTVRSRLRRALAQLRAKLDERHHGWALALVGPMPRGEVTASSTGFGAKLGFTLTVGAFAAFAWSSCDRETENVEQAQEPSKRERWEQRRTQVRAALAQRDTAEVDHEAPVTDADELERARRDAIARAGAGISELKRACIDDLERDVSGAITVSAVVIGDPQIGTIFDSVVVVTETVGDPEVIDCVREAMYAWIGEPPPVQVEARFVRTMPWVGRDEDDTRKERRIFEAIVGAHHGEVAFCQREHAFEGTGTVLLELTIGADRKASDSRVVHTDLPEAVVECIVTASQRWAFPADLVDKMFRYDFRLPVEGFDKE